MTRPLLSYVLTGDGPPVMLLHGLGGNHHQALGLLPDDLAVTRLAPDLPGHGDTDLLDDEPVNFAVFAGHIGALLESLGQQHRRQLGPLPIIGVSMGAGIAVALAAARPELVESLVLIRPAWLDVAPAVNLAPFSIIASFLERFGPVAGAESFRQTLEYQIIETQAPAMAASLLGQFTRPDAVSRTRVLTAMTNSTPLPTQAAYRHLDVDTLIIAAPDDPVHPDHIARTLHEWITGSELRFVPRKDLSPDNHIEGVQHLTAQLLSDRFQIFTGGSRIHRSYG